jgi:hypothetical protein
MTSITTNKHLSFTTEEQILMIMREITHEMPIDISISYDGFIV